VRHHRASAFVVDGKHPEGQARALPHLCGFEWVWKIG
jgi:hypothetical protein